MKVFQMRLAASLLWAISQLSCLLTLKPVRLEQFHWTLSGVDHFGVPHPHAQRRIRDTQPQVPRFDSKNCIQQIFNWPIFRNFVCWRPSLRVFAHVFLEMNSKTPSATGQRQCQLVQIPSSQLLHTSRLVTRASLLATRELLLQYFQGTWR